MGETIYSFCKNGKRYDRPQSAIEKQEPIATDEPVISRGAIVTLKGHKGKVLRTEGDQAFVSWEDASISKVPIASLGYAGRVEKGGPGSGVYERTPKQQQEVETQRVRDKYIKKPEQESEKARQKYREMQQAKVKRWLREDKGFTGKPGKFGTK